MKPEKENLAPLYCNIGSSYNDIDIFFFIFLLMSYVALFPDKSCNKYVYRGTG